MYCQLLSFFLALFSIAIINHQSFDMHHVLNFIIRIAYACFFGFVLLCHTSEIFQYVPQLLGGLLMMESISQLLELFTLKFQTRVGSGFFIVPVVILLISLYLFFCCEMPDNIGNAVTELNTMFKLKMELKLCGVCFVAFVLSELLISFRFGKPLFRPAAFAEQKAKEKEEQKARLAEQARLAAENNKKDGDVAK